MFDSSLTVTLWNKNKFFYKKSGETPVSLSYLLLLLQIDCRLVNGFWQIRSLCSLLLSTSITRASHFNCVVKALAVSTSCAVSRIITHPCTPMYYSYENSEPNQRTMIIFLSMCVCSVPLDEVIDQPL